MKWPFYVVAVRAILGSIWDSQDGHLLHGMPDPGVVAWWSKAWCHQEWARLPPTKTSDCRARDRRSRIAVVLIISNRALHPTDGGQVGSCG